MNASDHSQHPELQTREDFSAGLDTRTAAGSNDEQRGPSTQVEAAGTAAQRDPVEELTPLSVVRAFYDLCSLRAEDERMLWEKRGIEPQTSRCLGLVSGVPPNRLLLKALSEKMKLDRESLEESGLFHWKQGLKPNDQFCGMGIKRKHRAPRPEPAGLDWPRRHQPARERRARPAARAEPVRPRHRHRSQPRRPEMAG